MVQIDQVQCRADSDGYDPALLHLSAQDAKYDAETYVVTKCEHTQTYRIHLLFTVI